MEIDITGPKGIKSAAHVAFDTANGFFEGAIRCAEPVRDPENPTIIVSPTSPAITNLAFASELYLKALLMEYKITFPKTHRLDRLFNLLPKESQKKIRNKYAGLSGCSKLALKEHIVNFTNAFEIWRYSYENSDQIRVDRLTFLAQSLYIFVSEEKPSWSITKYLDSRIKDGQKTKVLSTANLGGGLMVRVVEAS